MSVKNDLKSGIIYNSIGKYSNVLISFIIQMVLARLLTPSEFGIVAVINIFLVFFQLIVDFGIGPAVIQRDDLSKLDIKHIYSFSVYFSFFLTLVFALLGNPISKFYQNNQLLQAVPIMSIVLLFSGLTMVPQNLLLKDKKFKVVNMIQISGSIVNGIVSILFALLGYSYLALIFGNIARALLQFILYSLSTKLSFHFIISLDPLKKIYVFARNQLFFNIINYFSRNLDNILIGKFMPSDQLGFYDKAYQLTLYPNAIFTSAITSTIQPVFSSYQSQTDLIKKGYLSISRILANFGIPLSVFLYFSSDEIINVLYGEQWSQSILVFQILSISIWIQMLQSSTGGFFQSANRTDLLLLSGILSTVVNIIGIVIGVYLGSIYTVATMILISFSFNFFQTNYLLINRAFKSSTTEFFKVLGKPLIIGGLEIITFLIIPELYVNDFLSLILKGIIFIFVLIIGLIITGQMHEVVKLVKKS
ncbi:oligosaccharide flippase family protein [Carnobacterium sp. PL24RED07]|uniref:lipopolysaccharide biosynthesis protein n=1 Tax=unclassified Carnobacterium TaxID=257487 RepID=UPI0011ED153D|nr:MULTISPECIES: lipopolysaccharide biosynthesis protein [unclassified Carnobacterium]KAF3299980.1 oligosaccharide flippase family protein [Carnobacterium sp. PL26RED25]KAF3304660.1 oligosaccharide flippase family protein [Carnobacterium sp. PL24RED07]